MKGIIVMISFFIICSCNQRYERQYVSENFKLLKIEEGVYACIHKLGGKAICNAGIIDNGNETIIFDTFLSPIAAEELLEVVEFYNLSPIKYVINSHFHNDHIRGNQVFGENVEIISTRETMGLIEKWEPEQLEFEKKFAPARQEYYDSLYSNYMGDSTDSEFIDIQMWRPYYQILANSSKEVITTLPNSFVDTLKILSGPNKEVQLISKGNGHTESDLILYLPEDDIIFSGDLVFNNCHPYMGDGFTKKWLSYLDFLLKLNPKMIIPGHGEMGKSKDLVEMKEYLISVEDIVNKMIQEGRTKEDIDSIQIPDKYRSWLFDRFFKFNLSAGLDKIMDNS